MTLLQEPRAFFVWIEPFCFSDGETIHQEGGERPMWGIGVPSDDVGVRQPETQGPGEFGPNSRALSLPRYHCG